ncbi:MAG: 6-carboxytetrahydropterin synthase [Bacteroidetes bacterium]|nr:6-carboxytetrahydropterin synthase [Bacteroidota bacterium]MBS1932174.1 6-carboxytetrahydropterin synthase [Bacteroidota bacterium]
MISVTKIFRFEMGHAIDEYDGMCKYIHGHSYVLHVTVSTETKNSDPIIPPGFIIDFKELKSIVQDKIIHRLDHALVLSEQYVKKHPKNVGEGQNLLIWPYEPSAENILFFVQQELQNSFPGNYKLVSLKLWETSDSFAEWTCQDIHSQI